VRCIECVTEPITPGHFCECCGRKLSLEERKGLNTTPVTPVAAPEPVAAPPIAPEPLAPEPVVSAQAVVSAPCESCGGPSEDGSLCALCQSAFQALLEGALPKAEESASDDLPATDVETGPAAAASPASAASLFGYLSDTDSLFSVADVTPGAPPLPTLTVAPLIDDEGLKATEEEAARVEAEEAARIEADRADAVRMEAARLEVEKAEAAKAEAARIDAAKEEAAKEAARVQAAKSKVVENPSRSTPKATTPSTGRQPARSGRTGSMVGIAAAVVIVASIGLGVGAAWYKIQGILPGQSAPAAAPADAAVATVAENVPKAPDPIAVAEAAIKASEAAAERAAAQAQASAVLKAKAAPNAATSRVQPKNVRQPIAPTGQVAAAAAPVAVIEPVRELVAPPLPPPVVVMPAAAVASIEPQRPFFEPKDVNEQPAVANRVEPRLPDELKTRDISEVLVVRLLVSQTGHPSSISLLRRSKTGQSLDDAVVAAIRQWTFSPARKKGETVSCWMNLGVPVGRAN
jgi:TonB family protein